MVNRKINKTTDERTNKVKCLAQPTCKTSEDRSVQVTSMTLEVNAIFQHLLEDTQTYRTAMAGASTWFFLVHVCVCGNVDFFVSRFTYTN